MQQHKQPTEPAGGQLQIAAPFYAALMAMTWDYIAAQQDDPEELSLLRGKYFEAMDTILHSATLRPILEARARHFKHEYERDRAEMEILRAAGEPV